MKPLARALPGLAFISLAGAAASAPPEPPVQAVRPTFDAEATAHFPAMDVPFSPLASPQARDNMIAVMTERLARESKLAGPSDIAEVRRVVEKEYIAPLLVRLRHAFAVDIEPETINGVRTDMVTPSEGIAPENRDRVLINLHGGGFNVGGGIIGQTESIPIASIGRIKVVSVDYRMAPEWRFPAASEDVAKVYAELIKHYRPENIGIFGCSAGAILTAESVAWFQVHGLPRPGAIAMGGGGGLAELVGDSTYVSSGLGGYAVPGAGPIQYFERANLSDPLVSPGRHDAVLKAFPPSLFLTGTRDSQMSNAIYTHARLVKLGIEADLHVWEGGLHCFSYWDLPESREAWAVTAKFFSAHLGNKPE